MSLSQNRILWVLFSAIGAILILGAIYITSSHAIALGSTTVVIDAVLYDGSINDDEEAVRLRNVSGSEVSLADWSLYDGVSQSALPLTLTIEAHETLWIAKDATAFTRQFGFQPDYEPDTWLGLTNTGDEVFLRDASDVTIDVLVYEGGNTISAGSGWLGSAVQPYTAISNSADGQILYRKLDPQTGLPVVDTNTAADWAQDTSDLLNGRRVLYPGWDLDRFFLPHTVTETAVLTIAVAPDNGYETVIQHINEAHESIRIEAHTFENVDIGNALVAASQRGVSVTVLLEGGPPGGISDNQKYICKSLLDAGGECWLMVTNKSQGIAHRYYFIHAKFMIIDGDQVMISSENFSPNSLPSDAKADGTWGRRGALLFTNAPSVVSHLEDIWELDFDPTHHRDITITQASDLAIPVDYMPPAPLNPMTYTVRAEQPAVFSGDFPFTVVQSPENSLSHEGTLLGRLGQAGVGDTVLVQQLYARPYWGATSSNAIDDPNVRLNAYMTAARNGARVRLFLDSYFDNSNANTSNFATCSELNRLASAENIDIACQLGNPAGLGVHNKMILAQINGRGYIHIGSINGSEQSHKGNREVALEVQSNDAYEYLADMFERDWVNYVYLPVLFNNYIGPADHPLISEVLYNPIGTDQDEFIELVNPTNFPVDLSGYSLSDALLPTDFADLRRFPDGTIIAPQDTLVVAQQATAFQNTYGVAPDFEILETTTAVPNLLDDLAWGDTATFLQMGNSGDIILLRDNADAVVDVVAYGDAIYSGQVSCGLTENGHSLRRTPYWRDTDSCSDDFVAWPAPDPNQLP